ncbi:MAG: DUF881 domain-containing protein [Oscillospiraceae bacterium]|nr:DUF881 domain-containing protein [Oscillospiraceae bacterium]
MENVNKKFILFFILFFIGIFITFFIPKLNTSGLSRGYVGYDDKLELEKEYYNLNKEYQRMLKNYNIAKNADIETQIKSKTQDLNQLELSLGLIPACGEGIEITLNDAALNFGDIVQIPNLVHNYDILYLVNELKTAGAEAISINNVRVVYNADIMCVGNFVGVSGQKIYAPFVIDAIGDKTVLKEYLYRPGGKLMEFMSDYRKLQVEVSVKDSLTLNKYIGVLQGNNLNIYKSN